MADIENPSVTFSSSFRDSWLSPFTCRQGPYSSREMWAKKLMDLSADIGFLGQNIKKNI